MSVTKGYRVAGTQITGTNQTESPAQKKLFHVQMNDGTWRWYAVVRGGSHWEVHLKDNIWPLEEDDYNPGDSVGWSNVFQLGQTNTTLLDIKWIQSRATDNLCLAYWQDGTGTSDIFYQEYTLNKTTGVWSNSTHGAKDTGLDGSNGDRKNGMAVDYSGRPWVWTQRLSGYSFRIDVAGPDNYATHTNRCNEGWTSSTAVATNSGTNPSALDFGSQTQDNGQAQCVGFKYKKGGTNKFGLFFSDRYSRWSMAFRSDSDAVGAAWSAKKTVCEYESHGINAFGDASRNDDHVCAESFIKDGDTNSTIILGGKTGWDDYHLFINTPDNDEESWGDVYVAPDGITYPSEDDGSSTPSGNTLTRPGHFIDATQNEAIVVYSRNFQAGNANATKYISYKRVNLETLEVSSETDLIQTSGSTNNFLNIDGAITVSTPVPVLAATHQSDNYIHWNWLNFQQPAEDYIYGCQDSAPGPHPDAQGYCSFGGNETNYTTYDAPTATSSNIISNPSFTANPALDETWLAAESNFDTASDWTWHESTSKITHTKGISNTALEKSTIIQKHENINIPQNLKFKVSYTISGRTSGSIRVQVGNVIEDRGTPGITATGNTDVFADCVNQNNFDPKISLCIKPTYDFDGSIEDVSVIPYTCPIESGALLITDADNSTFASDTGDWSSIRAEGNHTITGGVMTIATSIDSMSYTLLSKRNSVSSTTFADGTNIYLRHPAVNDHNNFTAIPTGTIENQYEGFFIRTDIGKLERNTNTIYECAIDITAAGLVEGDQIEFQYDIEGDLPAFYGVRINNGTVKNISVNGTGVSLSENLVVGARYTPYDKDFIFLSTPSGVTNSWLDNVNLIVNGTAINAVTLGNQHILQFDIIEIAGDPSSVKLIPVINDDGQDSQSVVLNSPIATGTYNVLFTPLDQISNIGIQIISSSAVSAVKVDNVILKQTTGGGFQSTNFSHLNTADDGSCTYGQVVGLEDTSPGENQIGGCMDPSAVNYNADANYDNGTCNYDWIPGCMDQNADNYNPNANIDDGSCIYQGVDPDEGLSTNPAPGDHILTLLDFRLNDDDDKLWSKSQKIEALNQAQYYVAGMAQDGLLTELYTSANDILLSNGKVTFYSAGIKPYRNKIFKIYDPINRQWAQILPDEEIKKITSSYITPDRGDKSVMAYIIDDTIHTRPTLGSIDIYYLRKPKEINDTINTELNAALHMPIAYYAEYKLWLLDNKTERADFALNLFAQSLEGLNKTLERGGKGA